MRCQNCGAELPDGEVYCRHCNILNKKPDARSKKRAETFAIIILVTELALFGIFFASKAPQQFGLLTLLVSASITSMKLKRK